MTIEINTLVIVGMGLIGGSFATALKQKRPELRVIGVGRTQSNLQRALALGVVDEISQDLTQVVHHADMVLLAVPVGQMPALIQKMAPLLPEKIIITDAGSTKSDVLALFQKWLPKQLPYCVPAHPIAGSDQSGVDAARIDLFLHRTVVLTPLPETVVYAAQQVAKLWEMCGANVEYMRAEEHDQIFAAVSHLPHLLAYAYVNMIQQKPEAQRFFDRAATGFRDFTRIAGSHVEMWKDISLANKAALLDELADYQRVLTHLEVLLNKEDEAGLQVFLSSARAARLKWQEAFLQRENSNGF